MRAPCGESPLDGPSREGGNSKGISEFPLAPALTPPEDPPFFSGNSKGISEFPLVQQERRSRHKADWTAAYAGMTHRRRPFG